MRIEETVDIAAPPERVWDVTIDLERWPSWTPSVTAVHVLDEGPVRPGLRARLTQPGYRPAAWTVTQVDDGREFVWETRSLGMRVRATHRIQAVGGGSLVTLVVETDGPTSPLFGWLVRRASLRFLPQEAAGLKHACER